MFYLFYYGSWRYRWSYRAFRKDSVVDIRVIINEKKPFQRHEIKGSGKLVVFMNVYVNDGVHVCGTQSSTLYSMNTILSGDFECNLNIWYKVLWAFQRAVSNVFPLTVNVWYLLSPVLETHLDTSWNQRLYLQESNFVCWSLK